MHTLTWKHLRKISWGSTRQIYRWIIVCGDCSATIAYRCTCLSQTFDLLYFRLYPEANVTRLGPWAHFNCSFSCSYILDPRDPLFLQIGSLYLSQVVKQIGTDHIYNTDTFNEMTPPSSDPTYLSAVSRSVFASMTAGECLGD